MLNIRGHGVKMYFRNRIIPWWKGKISVLQAMTLWLSSTFKSKVWSLKKKKLGFHWMRWLLYIHSFMLTLKDIDIEFWKYVKRLSLLKLFFKVSSWLLERFQTKKIVMFLWELEERASRIQSSVEHESLTSSYTAGVSELTNRHLQAAVHTLHSHVTIFWC